MAASEIKFLNTLSGDGETIGFKESLKNARDGITSEQTQQAFVFRRFDIFQKTKAEFGCFSALPRVPNSEVVDLQNFNTDSDSAMISMWDMFIKPSADSGITPRKKMYSRAGYPESSKNNWASISNNFKIYKQIQSGDDLYDVEFPKAIKDNNLNTIISFKGIDIDFEGTYIDTARSDVSVKIRFTLDSFDLLEKYYKSDDGSAYIPGEDASPTKKYVRFLDLLTPPDIQRSERYTNKGILLEVYTNNPSAPDSHKDKEKAKGFNSISYRNHLKLNLYIVDHTMTFDEITNKVDIEIEYRAAADVAIMEKDPQKNILYTPVNAKKIVDKLNETSELIKEGCIAKSEDTLQEIAKIKKIEFKQLVTNTESQWNNNGKFRPETDKLVGTTLGHPFAVRRYEYINDTEAGEEGDGPTVSYREGIRDPATGLPKIIGVTQYHDEASPKYKRLHSYSGAGDLHAYRPTADDFNIAENLRKALFPPAFRKKHFLSLNSLISVFYPAWARSTYATGYQVVLPFVPLPGAEGNGFYLGDLPIIAEDFEDWYNKRYINENIYYLDFNTLVKDIILNYVNPHLELAWYDREIPNVFNVSTKDLKGQLSMEKGEEETNIVRVQKNQVIKSKFTWDNRDSIDFDIEGKQAYEWIFMVVYLEQGMDFAASHNSTASVGDQIESISDNYIVIEGKSPYGPFKNLKLSKNDSGYLREIRSVQQKITDIAQLGAVYDTTLDTYPNCPDFRFFPGEMCFLYIPDFGLSTDTDNLAYKLNIGGHQIITKVSHKIDLEGTAKMTTSITMRYWAPGVVNTHTIINTPTECKEVKVIPIRDDDEYTGQVLDYGIGG